jgi:ribosomal protein S18 acetylase RimI-like enzyme
MKPVALGPQHAGALHRFFTDLPAGDLTFVKEDVTDPAAVRAWAEAGTGRWVALDDDGAVAGYVAVRRLPGWSDHVGELRLVVDPANRGRGLGRTLARYALVRAIEAGLTKLVVELVADQHHAIAMFTGIGFAAEALLCDHIRDRDGELRDLVVLAHRVSDTWSAMAGVGLPDELAP